MRRAAVRVALGEEKTRINFGAHHLEQTDILLLDEPTNHSGHGRGRLAGQIPSSRSYRGTQDDYFRTTAGSLTSAATV